MINGSSPQDEAHSTRNLLYWPWVLAPFADPLEHPREKYDFTLWSLEPGTGEGGVMSMLVERLLLEDRVQKAERERERDDFLVADSKKKDGSGGLGDPAVKLCGWQRNQ